MATTWNHTMREPHHERTIMMTSERLQFCELRTPTETGTATNTNHHERTFMMTSTWINDCEPHHERTFMMTSTWINDCEPPWENYHDDICMAADLRTWNTATTRNHTMSKWLAFMIVTCIYDSHLQEFTYHDDIWTAAVLRTTNTHRNGNGHEHERTPGYNWL